MRANGAARSSKRCCPSSGSPTAIGTDADYPAYVTNLQLTVFDLQLQNVIVDNAIPHHRDNRWDEVRTLDDIEALLERFPADQEGNRAAAEYLWGFLYGDRLGRLRGLVRWARETGLTDQERPRTWAYASEFESDFAGRVKGLGIGDYCWLVMRLGVDTVKPDVWLHAFIKRVPRQGPRRRPGRSCGNGDRPLRRTECKGTRRGHLGERAGGSGSDVNRQMPRHRRRVRRGPEVG